MFHKKQTLPVSGALWFVIINFLISLSVAILAPISPIYFRKFVTNDAFVGYIVSFMGFVFLLGALVSGKLLKKFKKFPLFMISLFVIILSYFTFMIVTNIIQLIFLLFFRSIAMILNTIILGLYVRDSVKRTSSLGKTEGFFFTFLNIAFLIGPLLGGALAENFGFNFVFSIASFFTILAGIIALSKIPRDEYVDNDNHILFSNIKDYFKNKNTTLLYTLSIGLALWWAAIYTFLPLFLTEEGVSKITIGYALFFIVIPLIILELPAGKLADKFGVKRFLTLGFLLLGIFSIFIYFIKNPLLIILFIVLACIGAAFVEPLRETYLFKMIRKKDNTRFYTIYMTGFDVGYLLGPLLLSSVLFYSNFKVLFLTTSVLMFLFALSTRFIDDTKK